MVTALSIAPLTVQAKGLEMNASAPAHVDMPYTPQFEASVTRYRNCVVMQIDKQARTTVAEMAEPEICCGFGGTFSARYPEVSVAMADAKLQDVAEAGIDVLVSADPGCLMHLGGRLSRDGSPVRSVHVASLVREALR